jgi:hypothetical protein
MSWQLYEVSAWAVAATQRGEVTVMAHRGGSAAPGWVWIGAPWIDLCAQRQRGVLHDSARIDPGQSSCAEEACARGRAGARGPACHTRF